MATFNSTLDLQSFYPDDLKILDIEDTEDQIIIYMHSTSTSCTCHKCGALLQEHHGSHHRRVQDLPILGKRVLLDMQIYDYECNSDVCGGFAPTETFDGFLSYNSRMTDRLEDFACVLAVETSCEASARIMKSMNIKISGDTVIRLLLKRYSKQPTETCGCTIGVDDFAFKKRHTYGTIIVDEETHNPVAVLDGRDGASLKEWLKQNQHVTTVTRDRASAYAKAVEEILPDCMQIADRFHLHQNLMEAVNKILGREIPITNGIPVEPSEVKDDLSTSPLEMGKKNAIKCG
jgi:transposase